MLAFRKCCSAAANKASSKSLYQWRHAQTKQVVDGMMGREAWAVELPRSTRRLPSWPHTTPTSPFSRPMLLLPARGAKRVATRGTAPPTTKSKYSGPQDKNQHPDVKSTSDPFVRWEIPWDGKTVVITMTAIGISFWLTGLAVGIVVIGFDFTQGQPLDSDKTSLIILIGLVLQTFVGTSVMKACIESYSPLPKGLFSYDWRDPFSAKRGWLLWGVVGTFCSFAAVLLAVPFTNRETFSRSYDALSQLLPLIGASGTSTALLLAITGIIAPIFEEIVFRGFLLTSLTKWVPTYIAVLGSAGAFALAHFNPAKLPVLFAVGVVLGFSYSKSGNLLTPIMIHGLWNSTVILLLTFLIRQGYDIQKLIESPTSIIRQPVNQTPHCERKE